jgi:hypothetical protein
MTAAVIGGTAKVASQAGAKAGAANAQAAQPAQAGVQQAPPTAEPAVAEPAAAAPPTQESTDDKMDQLAKLKQLLDMGALTQEEFDGQKARILGSM